MLLGDTGEKRTAPFVLSCALSGADDVVHAPAVSRISVELRSRTTFNTWKPAVWCYYITQILFKIRNTEKRNERKINLRRQQHLSFRLPMLVMLCCSAAILNYYSSGIFVVAWSPYGSAATHFFCSFFFSQTTETQHTRLLSCILNAPKFYRAWTIQNSACLHWALLWCACSSD